MLERNCLFRARWLEHECSSIGLGKTMSLLQSANIALKMSVLPI